MHDLITAMFAVKIVSIIFTEAFITFHLEASRGFEPLMRILQTLILCVSLAAYGPVKTSHGRS